MEDLSTRLRCSERKCNAQAKELSEARDEAKAVRSELSRLARAKQTSSNKNSEERAAMTQTLRKRDSELANLKEKIEAVTGELSAEQEGTVSLRTRLVASERELRLARERARVAEDNVATRASLDVRAKSVALEERIAGLEAELKEQSAETERAKEEARTATSELRTSEKEARVRAREAASSQDRLRVEKERSARVHLELQVRAQTEIPKVRLSDCQASDIRGISVLVVWPLATRLLRDGARGGYKYHGTTHAFYNTPLHRCVFGRVVWCRCKFHRPPTKSAHKPWKSWP